MDLLSYFALIVLLILVVSVIGVIAFLGALPGKLAKKNGHAQARAVTMAGWMGLLLPPLWPLAMVWACITHESAAPSGEAGSEQEGGEG
jgi:hypothetical protein